MAYWLVKSEPSAYSFDQLMKDKQTTWDGVRNYAARNHLKSMKKGDEVLFYHSNEGLEIVGIAKVAQESYQDPSTDDNPHMSHSSGAPRAADAESALVLRGWLWSLRDQARPEAAEAADCQEELPSRTFHA